jgi:hypothetical protein
MSTEPVYVTIRVEANPTTETVEIDRAEWDAMTPADRRALLDDMAEIAMQNAGGFGWGIDDPADAAADDLARNLFRKEIDRTRDLLRRNLDAVARQLDDARRAIEDGVADTRALRQMAFDAAEAVQVGGVLAGLTQASAYILPTETKE